MNILPTISRFGICLVTALLTLANAAWAQNMEPTPDDNVTDSLLWVESKFDNETKRTDIIHFNPEDYQVQKLWRNRENDSLFPRKAYQRLYFGTSVGILAISDRISTCSQGVFNAYAGYRFSPIHSLRFNLGYSRLSSPIKFRGAPSLTMGVDYVASLSNYIGGYNPNRTVDFSAVIGIGARITRYTSRLKISPYAQLGLNIGFNFSNQFRLFVEPYVGLTARQINLFMRKCRSRFNLHYGIMAGIQYNLVPLRSGLTTPNNNFDSWFFDYSCGWYQPLAQGSNIHMSGVQSQFSVGCWITPMIGVRVGGVAQEHWYSVTHMSSDTEDYDIYRSKHKVAIRGEVMFNIPNMFKRWRKADHWFDLNVLGGMSYGWSHRDHLNHSKRVKCTTWAYTAAVQTLFRASTDTWLYLEPRFERNGIDIPYKKTELESSLTLSIGTRLYRSNKANRRLQRNNLTHRDSLYRFRRNLWLGAHVGMLRVFHSTDNRPTGEGVGFSPAFGGEIGYDLHPLASFRGIMTYGTTKFNNIKYKMLDMRLSYMLNISNVWQGQTPKRRFDIYWNIGPSLSFVSRRNREYSFGIWTSLQGIMRVTPKWDVYAEPLFQYNFKNKINPGYGQYIENLKMGVQLGTRYHF